MLETLLSEEGKKFIRKEIFEIHKELITEILESQLMVKRYYKKSELAKLFKCHPSLIDTWEEAGLRYIPRGETGKDYDILEVYDTLESLKVSRY